MAANVKVSLNTLYCTLKQATLCHNCLHSEKKSLKFFYLCVYYIRCGILIWVFDEKVSKHTQCTFDNDIAHFLRGADLMKHCRAISEHFKKERKNNTKWLI